jgi:predicted NBD/HSP70 family sugar kinase
MTSEDPLVLGLDVGGTASRAVVVTLTGRLAAHTAADLDERDAAVLHDRLRTAVAANR